MKKPRCVLWAALLLSLATVDRAQAGRFFSDFDSADLPAEAKLAGSANIKDTDGVDGSGYLSLIPAEKDRLGTIIVNDLDAGEEVTSFISTFHVRIGGGGEKGADGFSFCHDRHLPPAFGENSRISELHFEKYKLGQTFVKSGLVISFFTYLPQKDGSVAAPVICVKYDDEELTKADVPNLRTGTAFVPVIIQLDANALLQVFFDGVPVIQDLKLEKFQPKSGAQFGLGARSGALTDNHDIDNLGIITGTAAQPLPEMKTPQMATVKNRAELETKTTPPTAGRFFADFNSPETPPRSQISGDAKIESSGGVNGSGYLRLTPAEPKKTGTYILPDLDGGQPVTSFIVAAQVRVGGGKGAEGFSFCHAQKLPALFGVGGAEAGLSISFDTFIYASGAMQSPAVRILYKGKPLEKMNLNDMRTGENFVPLVIKLDADGKLNVFYGDTHVYQDFKLESFQPLAGGQFGFGANCIVATDNHCLDDLVVLTGTEARPLPALDVAAIANLLANRNQTSPNFTVSSMVFLNGSEVRSSIIYQPNAPGSYPAILFHPRQHIPRPAALLPFPFQPDNPFPQLGELFARHNYVLCVLPAWGQSDETTASSTATAPTETQWLEDNAQQAELLRDALTGLKALENVDENRLAVMGDGSGANAAIFAAAVETNARAFVLFAPDTLPWTGNPLWQNQIKQSLEAAPSPVFLLQPANARDISLFSAGRQILEKRKDLHKVELFPSYGETADQAQEFVAHGSDLWKNDVLPFLANALKPAASP